MSITKYIELYSGNRNRNLYPLQAYFEVPFSSYIENNNTPKKDPIVKGAVLYTYTSYSIDNLLYGITQPGTTFNSFYLDPNMDLVHSYLLGQKGYRTRPARDTIAYFDFHYIFRFDFVFHSFYIILLYNKYIIIK